MRARMCILCCILFVMGFSSCFEEERFVDTKKGNFEALWTILDQNYCFFEYKKVNWDSVHTVYEARISEKMDDESLFYVLGDMLSILRDGHVNLSASHDLARNWSWKENYPDNFDTKIQQNYLGTDYQLAGGMKYKILQDNIGYIYYESFSQNFGESTLDYILSKMSVCKGIIIDVRNNGGGYLSNAGKLASRFFKIKTLVGYIRHKTDKGHHQFSSPFPVYITPSTRVNFQSKPVVVLTNRACFSSANDFVNSMRYAENAIIIGDKTGGGSGLPFSSELPNGWSVRFSSSPLTDAQDKQIEFGIEPDIKVEMREDEIRKGLDSIIEKARQVINSKS